MYYGIGGLEIILKCMDWSRLDPLHANVERMDFQSFSENVTIHFSSRMMKSDTD